MSYSYFGIQGFRTEGFRGLLRFSGLGFRGSGIRAMPCRIPKHMEAQSRECETLETVRGSFRNLHLH